MATKIKWQYGENENQRFYDAYVGKDYLCVFANKWQPNVWMGIQRDKMIHDKTANDRVRKRQGLPIGCDIFLLQEDHILCSDNPEYMMKKVEWCYRHNSEEISR